MWTLKTPNLKRVTKRPNPKVGNKKGKCMHCTRGTEHPVATAVFIIKLPMAYVFASTIRGHSRWLANVSATCDLVGRSQCHSCMTTMIALGTGNDHRRLCKGRGSAL